MSERENLLLRWARLKQAARAADEIGAASAGSAAMAAREAPFDPASLPSIEEIAADTEIIGFLRAGVPAELTRAALHRAWTTDPAIRDFIGIAENQWDFNDPAAMTGFGPLVPPENGGDILAQIFDWQPRKLGDLAAAEPTIASNADAGASDRQLLVNHPPPVSPDAAPDEMVAHAKDDNTPAAGATRKIRRHGSALPR